MNKKIKISLLGVLLTSSLAGLATTIASCSASATPELKVEQNSNLITELDKVLTEFLTAIDDEQKKTEFNSWIKNDELPQIAKDVIFKNIVFKNENKVVPFNDVFEKFLVSSKDIFPQNPTNPIPAIDIEIKIKEGPFVIASSSTPLLKFKTGTLGKLNPVQITNIDFSADIVETKNKITTELNKAMDAAITYQDKFALYTKWTQGTSFPVGISNYLFNYVKFRTSAGSILSWNAVFDTFEITTTEKYPSTSNTKIPNMTLNTKLKSGYLIEPAILDKDLKFPDIAINSNTGKIKLDIGFKNSILAALESQLSKDLSVGTTYQERKVIFNNWNNSAGTMKPDSISLAAKEIILSNLALNKFGYDNPLAIDDFISKISIVPVNAGESYTNDLIANLPLMKLVLVLDDHKFVTPNNNYVFSINLPPLTANSGVGEFTFAISSTLEKDMTNLFSNELIASYDENKAKYESWNSYNSFPVAVKDALEAGISFKTNIDIPNISLYSNMIDIEKTQIIKQPFPETAGLQIMPMQIKFVLKPGRSVRIGGSLTNELPPINISTLPIAGSTIYQFDTGQFQKVLDFLDMIKGTIAGAMSFGEKKAIYDSYTSFATFPEAARKTLENAMLYDIAPPEEKKKFVDLVEIVPAFSKDGPFPSESGKPIPSIRLEFKFLSNFTFKYNNIYSKKFPITINFSGITS